MRIKLKLERVWAMPNHRTFQIKPIKQLIQNTFNNEEYTNPFPFPFKQDALEYLKTIQTNSTKNLAYDPPFSQRQLREKYNDAGLALDQMNNGYWAKLKDEIARIMQPNGKTISFGWNSGGIGKNRGFEITKILLVCHGSMHNDTICTVENKIQTTLGETI